MLQKTIKEEISFSGIGVHSGKNNTIALKPSAIDSGINFFSNNKKIELNINNVMSSQLCTKISKNNVSISTVEHLLSTLYGLEISNVDIHIEGDEIPIMDGCSYTFSEKLLLLVYNQNAQVKEINLTQNVIYKDKEKLIIAVPNDSLEINYFIDYENILPGFMNYKYLQSPENYLKNISKARTFGFFKDVDYLRSMGLALGADLQNTLVIDKEKYLSEPNYQNEPVRHKILDLIGDLSFAGAKLNAKIFAYKTGHKEHLEFVKKLL